jgi:hypothetical protein
MEDRDAVQSDWNGSARVALISIERSARKFVRPGFGTGSLSMST